MLLRGISEFDIEANDAARDAREIARHLDRALALAEVARPSALGEIDMAIGLAVRLADKLREVGSTLQDLKPL